MMLMFHINNFTELLVLSLIAVVRYGIPIIFAIWLFRSVRQIQSKLDAIERRSANK